MKEMKIKQNSVEFQFLKIGCPFESLYLEKTHTTQYQIWFQMCCYVFLMPKRDVRKKFE